MNKLDIWDTSPLHRLSLEDEFKRFDFQFKFSGQNFTHLFFLADGIYLSISHFVQFLSDPSMAQIYFAKWQEGAWKDVERTFGVLKGKFHCITHPIEK